MANSCFIWKAILTLLLTSELLLSKQIHYHYHALLWQPRGFRWGIQPSSRRCSYHGGSWGGPPSPCTTTWEDLGLFQRGKGVVCAKKKVKPRDGDAATAVRHIILFPPHVLHIILHRLMVDPLWFAQQSFLLRKKKVHMCLLWKHYFNSPSRASTLATSRINRR